MRSMSLSSYPAANPKLGFQADSPALTSHHDFTVDLPAARTSEWVTKVSEYKHEREAAFRLVHEAYFRGGLSSPNPMGMRVIKHHLSAHTDVMVAKRSGTVVLTSTLVRDAECGLPMESLFASEVDAMRADGLHLAEISCLASDVSLQKTERFEVLVKLIGLTLQVARRRGVDRLLLAVHPRHARVYQRLFGCVPCSDVKEYAAVQGNPAVLCMHDFAQLDELRYPLYEQVYGSKYDSWQLDGIRMTEAEQMYFRQALSTTVPDMVPVAA